MNTSHKHPELPVLELRRYKAVQFIKKQFKSYGYKADIDEFSFLSYTDPNLVELSVDGFDGEIQANHLSYSVNGDLSGEMVYAGLGTKEELEKAGVTGKIALIQRGSLTFAEKVLNAAEKGAGVSSYSIMQMGN